MSLRQKFLRLEYIILSCILLVALALRLWGTSFGLPYRYHPDEPQHVAEAAKMLADRTLEPPVFNNPPFYKYVLMAGDAGFFAVNLLFGDYESTDAFVKEIRLDPAPLYLLGRVISALAGTLTVLVVYLLGKSAYNRNVGLVAALFLAVAFLHVRDSHYAVNDALLTLLVTLSLYGAVLIGQRGHKRDYILAGVAVGLAFATKYTAIFLLIPVILAHFFSPGLSFKSWGGLKLKLLIGMGLLIGLAAIIGSPYFLLKPVKVFNDISSSIYTFGAYGFEGWQIDTTNGYIFYLKSLWWGLGAGLLTLSLLGIVLAFVRHRKEDILLLTFPLLLYIFMGRQQMYFARFLLPLVPILLILAAAVVEMVANYVYNKIGSFRTPTSAGLMLLITLVVILQPISASIRHNYLLTQKDTRTLAKEWIEENIPDGAKIVVDWPHHGPPLSTLAEPEPNSARSYDVLVAGGHGIADHSLDYYRAEEIQYLVLSSSIANISVADNTQANARRKFYVSIDEKLEMIYRIQPNQSDQEPDFIFDEIYGPAISLWQRERPGPVIEIYQLKSYP